jgi:hypothetical protein
MPASSSHIHADLKNQAIEAACKKLPARPGYEFGRNRNVLSAIFCLLSMTSGTLRAELVFRTNSALALRRRGDHHWYITPDELRFLRLCRTANRSTKGLMAQCAEGKVAGAEKCGRRRKSMEDWREATEIIEIEAKPTCAPSPWRQEQQDDGHRQRPQAVWSAATKSKPRPMR